MASEPALRERALPPGALLTLLVLQFVRNAVERDPVWLAERWLPLWRAVVRDPAGAEKLAALWCYLARQLESPKERFAQAQVPIHDEDEPMGKTIYQQLIEEGMEKGLEKGRAEGRAEMLVRLIRRRFGELPEELHERLLASHVETLDRVGERLLTAASIDELFA